MTRLLATALALLLAACDDGNSNPPDAGGMDGGVDGGGTPDSGPVWTGPGCNEELGIECDGDWAGRCATPCSASECCSPQEGRFSCVPRGEDGSCPTANIWVDATRIEHQTAVEWRYFPEDDCALVEGCVGAPGWRRLLLFGTWTPNTGTADLYLGRPANAPPFEYSACHEHFHFNGYAQYELRRTDGSLAAEGHKQAFCLLDFYRYPGTDETGAHYDCDNQGIQRGWQDVYDADLDCQWVDVTGVDPGDYRLRIDLNVDHVLLESNYDDNSAEVTVTIPPDSNPVDVTDQCNFDRYAGHRECGWNRVATTYRCEAGTEVSVGCSSACGLGSCNGDSIIRVCPTGGPCTAREVIAWNDDSGCGTSYDYCSRTTFTCPGEAGTTTDLDVYWAPYDDWDTESTCTPGVTGATAVTP